MYWFLIMNECKHTVGLIGFGRLICSRHISSNISAYGFTNLGFCAESTGERVFVGFNYLVRVLGRESLRSWAGVSLQLL